MFRIILNWSNTIGRYSEGKKRSFTIPRFHSSQLWEWKVLKIFVGKEENAGNQHFLLLPQWFLLWQNMLGHFYDFRFVTCNRLTSWDSLKRHLVKAIAYLLSIILNKSWHNYRLVSSNVLALSHTILTFNDPWKETFWKHCGKMRKCW